MTDDLESVAVAETGPESTLLIQGSNKSENQKEKTNSTLNSQPLSRHSDTAPQRDILFSGNRQIPGLATGAVRHSLLVFLPSLLYTLYTYRSGREDTKAKILRPPKYLRAILTDGDHGGGGRRHRLG